MEKHHVRVYYSEEIFPEIMCLAEKYKLVAMGYPIIGREVKSNQRFTFKTSDLANQFLKDVNGLVKAVEEKGN